MGTPNLMDVSQGRNDLGAVGDGTETSRSTPYELFSLGSVESFDLGYYQTCALVVNGSVYCWVRMGLARRAGRYGI